MNRNAIDGVKSGGAGKGANGSNGADANGGGGNNDSFNKHYNKELKVSEGKLQEHLSLYTMIVSI